MKIIFKTSNAMSNFEYCSKLFNNKKVLNGFNKLEENLLGELVSIDEIDVQNVIFEKEIIGDLYLCYPLSVVIEAEIKFNSLHELIKEIRRVYWDIYEEEENTFIQLNKNPMLINRGRSNGKFGIWGHDIYDLVIESIGVYEGTIRPMIKVGIGS